MNFTLHRYIDQPQAQLDFPPDSAYPSAQAQHIRYLEGWENHRPKGGIFSLWKLGTAPYFATFSLGKIMNLVTLLLFRRNSRGTWHGAPVSHHRGVQMRAPPPYILQRSLVFLSHIAGMLWKLDENGPFIDDLPMKHGDVPGAYEIKIYQRVTLKFLIQATLHSLHS